MGKHCYKRRRSLHPVHVRQMRSRNSRRSELAFRLENLASMLMDQMISQINITITAKSLRRIANPRSVPPGLLLDNFTNQFRLQPEDVPVQPDIRQLFTGPVCQPVPVHVRDIRAIINEYFLRNFDASEDGNHLEKGFCAAPRRFSDGQQFIHQCCEKFCREVLSLSLSMQQLDNFVSTILNTLHTMIGSMPTEVLLRVKT
jgi:hypothetical protein